MGSLRTPPTILVVGAGFAGAVCARELADAGNRVLIIDRRPHLGGNAYDEYDKHGVLVHRYGPHIFHTNGARIFDWLSRMTDWRLYEHRVLASVDGRLFPMPINRTTINALYNLDLDEQGVAEHLARMREPKESIENSEDVVLTTVGRDLCEKFFRGYTRKQWGLDLSELDAGVVSRIPTRTNTDDRYFVDAYQSMPSDGYARMFQRMLDHPHIEIRIATDYDTVKSLAPWLHTVYTGPIDAYFNCCFGRLPYRSLRFEHEHIPDTTWFQPVGTVNYPNEHAFTRITEFKHLTGQSHSGTSIVREYPQSEGDPYYPIPRRDNEALYQRYRDLAKSVPDVTFVGRLAQYRYYNMDQVAGAAIAASLRISENL